MLNQERWKEIETKPLIKGTGNDVDHACVMQMVSYVAGEPWTDTPQCACPILTRCAIRLNDCFNDEHRQKLKPFIPLLVGTRMNDDTQIARKRFIFFRYVTNTYPLLLELWKLPELAKELRGFTNDIDAMAKAADFLKTNKWKIYSSASASAYADAYAYASADAYAYASADADASASAYASADASAYASADAYADASALRERIVASALETLRLAIEIKIETDDKGSK